MKPDSDGTEGPHGGHLAILCDVSGRIGKVLCDQAGLFEQPPAPGRKAEPGRARVRGRMLSRFVAPGGAQHLAHLLARVSEQGAVSEWLLDLQGLQGADAPVTYRLWAVQSAEPDQAALLVLGTTDASAPVEAVMRAAEAAAGQDARVAALLARLQAHATPAAQIQDLREQVRGLQEQVQPPPGLDNRLLRMAAHDLRNPLLVLSMGCSYLLHEGQGLGEDQRAMLSDSLDTCDFMNRLVDGMVDLAEVAVGRLRLTRAPTDLAALLEAAVRRSEELARERKSTIVVERAPDGAQAAEPVVVAVDAARMAQVFGQLLSNALIHCPEGTRVRAWIERTEREVRIAVADDGPGIAPALRPKLFRPFGKPHADIAPKYYGAGVGLAVARRIVEGHDGTLDVDSEAGKGCCVRVALPLRD
jgi:signal transduction histidine kinase